MDAITLTLDGRPVGGAPPWRIEPRAPERDALRGDAAVTLDGPAPGDAAGGAVANVGDVDGDGREDVLVGTPGAGRRGAALLALGGSPQRLVRFRGARPGDSAGSVSIVPSSALDGAQLASTGCQPNRLWSFPLSLEHVLPRCRRASRVVDSPAFSPSPDAGEIARFNPEPACGAPSRTCQPSAYRSGNARLHGPDVGLTTAAPVDVVDSYGDRLAALQRTDDPACFTVFDRALRRVSATCDPTGDPPAPHPIELWVQGRACMASRTLEDRYYLVRLLDPSGLFGAAYREFQGFVRRDQVSLGQEQTTVGGATYSPQALAEAAYSGCGPRPPKRRPVPTGFGPRSRRCRAASACSASGTAT